MNIFKSHNVVARRGSFNYLCVADVETSGLSYNTLDPSDGYQIVSFGAIIVDAHTLEELDNLYLTCQWNGASTWSDGAEKVHGLSKEYLSEHGLPEDEFVATIAEWLYSYFPPDGDANERVVKFAGQNFRSFDHYFIKNLFDKYSLPLRAGSRFVDTSTLGYVIFGCYDSDELFKLLGFDSRSSHNALDDARMSLEAIRVARQIALPAVNKMYQLFD